MHATLAATAAQGRQMGVYGPEVAVPETASTLDRALARIQTVRAITNPERLRHLGRIPPHATA